MTPVFVVTALVALISAVAMVLQRNPVYSAVWLLVTFISIAVMFLTLQASFLASIHVIVYTGAILVLFLFVIMLLNLQEHELGAEYPLPVKASVAGMCTALFGVLSYMILQDESLRSPVELPTAATAPDFGSVASVGLVLFQKYGLQFELVSVLIIVAMFGAVILAKKKLPE